MIRALIGKTEHFFAAISVLGLDNPAHFMCTCITAIPNILEGYARRNVERAAQIAGLLCTKVKYFLGFPVGRDDAAALAETAESVMLCEVELGRIEGRNVYPQAPVGFF
jgi:hypothetical protein